MYICIYTRVHMINIDIYMNIWLCKQKKEIYMCIYWFILLYIYIKNVKLKPHEKLKKKEKKRQKTSTSKKIIERRKEKGLETSNGKSKKTIYY